MTGAATALPSDLSWEQFLELLEQDEYRNAELINGQVVVVTPNWIHQRIVTTLIWLIKNWISAEPGRGEVTVNPRVKITHNRGHLPDVAWYAADRVDDEGNQPDGPPDLAVEVLSPSTRTFDLVRKRADYARTGRARTSPSRVVRERGAAALDNPTLHLLRLEDDRVAEVWFHNREQSPADAFWSAR